MARSIVNLDALADEQLVHLAVTVVVPQPGSFSALVIAIALNLDVIRVRWTASSG